MKILYVHGNSVTRAIAEALYRLGYDVEIYPKKEASPFLQDEVIEEIVNYINKKEITHIVSIHLIYNLAMAAYKSGIKYISLIWDAPYFKLYTPFGQMKNCYFSVFDKVDYQRFVNDGIPNVLYQPLAVDKEVALRLGEQGEYLNEISFVGNLYDNNLYDEYMQGIPDMLHEYFNSIFEEAAFKWDGINRVYGKTGEEIIRYLRATCPKFKMVNPFDIDDTRYFESLYLVRKLANIERICIFNKLAEAHNVTIYTGSKNDLGKLEGVKIMPPVNPRKEAPTVFSCSKINLNITLHGIEGGTPQRVLDIMEAGGFVISSYSPETAEIFEEDKEIVMFKTPEELLEKVDYYLEHEEERRKIARAGHEKVIRSYTYDIKMKKLMNWVEGKGSE